MAIQNNTNNENRLRQVREALKMKQKEFALKLGVTQSYLSAVELGKKEITTKLSKKLIELFQVSPEWLMQGIGSIFSEPNRILISTDSGFQSDENSDFDQKKCQFNLLKIGITSEEEHQNRVKNANAQREKTLQLYRNKLSTQLAQESPDLYNLKQGIDDLGWLLYDANVLYDEHVSLNHDTPLVFRTDKEHFEAPPFKGFKARAIQELEPRKPLGNVVHELVDVLTRFIDLVRPEPEEPEQVEDESTEAE